MTVPSDARPGNCVSVLVVQTTNSVPVEGTLLFDQIIQKVMAVDITVEGTATSKLEVSAATYDVSNSLPTLSVEIKNPGDLRLRPAGTIVVKDASGQEVLSANVTMGSVYARTETLLQFVLPQPLPAGSYTIDLSLADADTKAEAKAPATPIQTAIVFQDIAIVAGPDASAPQFVTVTGTVVNNGPALPNAGCRSRRIRMARRSRPSNCCRLCRWQPAAPRSSSSISRGRDSRRERGPSSSPSKASIPPAVSPRS
ncbi:MAG: hypothetical protein QM589_18695 [Thermomicrobiales bacterium]